jgi:Pyruvate/2-oxoacid:ferredoxin oxidoreductase gamma subunit
MDQKEVDALVDNLQTNTTKAIKGAVDTIFNMISTKGVLEELAINTVTGALSLALTEMVAKIHDKRLEIEAKGLASILEMNIEVLRKVRSQNDR